MMGKHHRVGTERSAAASSSNRDSPQPAEQEAAGYYDAPQPEGELLLDHHDEQPEEMKVAVKPLVKNVSKVSK